MRILYIHQYFATPLNSTGTRSYEFAKRLVELGNEVTMLTSNSMLQIPFNYGEKVKEIFVDGIKVIVLNIVSTNKTSFKDRLKAFTAFSYEATKIGKRKKYDLVFATSTPLTVSYPAIKISKALSIPMIFEVRDVWPDVPIGLGILKNPLVILLAKKLEKKVYKTARKIVALSPDMADNIVSKGVPQDKVVIIPNASDNCLFEIDNESLEKFLDEYQIFRNREVVLYAGTIGMVNGLSYMVDLAVEMKKFYEKVAFVVIGDGKEREKVMSYAEACGVLNRNFFLFPPMPKKKIVLAMKASSLVTSFVINNKVLWANSANKFFDGLAAGKPIVINYGGWQANVLEKNNAGINIPPESPEDGAKMIKMILDDKTVYREMCKNAKKLALEEYDRDIQFRKLYEIFIEIVK